MPQVPTPPKTYLAYCDQCKIGLGWGSLQPTGTSGHFVGTTLHNGSLTEIDPSESIGAGEDYNAFLARMVKKYVTK